MGGEKRRAKRVTIGVAAQPEKKPKFSDPCIGGDLPLAWRFSACDRGGPFPWNIQPDAKYREVIEKLHEFEGKNWPQIIDGGSHPITKDKICKEAQDRLAKIKRDDVDELMSLRLAGDNRVWCVQANNIMRVLWWDAEHQVCPTLKDKADRVKARKKRAK